MLVTVLGVRLRAAVRGRSAKTTRSQPTSPYATSKLAQEMLARRAWEEDGIPTLIARSFNHVGPRQDPSFVAAGIARQIALHRSGDAGAGS